MAKKKAASVGQTIGGILVGFDQQIFRTTPPTNELVAKGDRLAPVAASGGGTMRVAMPGDADGTNASPATTADGDDILRLAAPGVEVIVDLEAGGRIASLVIDGRELLKIVRRRPSVTWGSFPMVPVRRPRPRRDLHVPGTAPTAAGAAATRTPSTGPSSTVAGGWSTSGPSRPSSGPTGRSPAGVSQRFELAADHLTCRLELDAAEPMPASMGWHPWFLRRLAGPARRARARARRRGRCTSATPTGITTTKRVSPPPPGPWDDCFTDLRRPPVLRWPGFLELTIESDCPAWVVYTEPEDALCVEPQTAPPDALNTDPTVVEPGRPLVAEMTWRWRSLA